MNIVRCTHTRTLAGMLLMDCIIYVALFFVVLAMAFSAFYTCWDNSRDFRRATDSIATTLRAGECWRADIRDSSGDLRVEATDGKQILCIPQKNGEIDYGFFDGAVWRRNGHSGEWAEVLQKIKSSRMEPDKRQKITAWKWELELATHRKGTTVVPLFTFEAVPKMEVSN